MRADRSAELRENQYSGKQWTLSIRATCGGSESERGDEQHSSEPGHQHSEDDDEHDARTRGLEIDTHNNTQSTRIEDSAMFRCEQACVRSGFSKKSIGAASLPRGIMADKERSNGRQGRQERQGKKQATAREETETRGRTEAGQGPAKDSVATRSSRLDRGAT